MNRRDFLRLLLAAPIAATLDVERLLWVPEKTIFLPPHPHADFPQWIADEGLRILRERLTLVRIMNREYENATYERYQRKIATSKVGGVRLF